METLLIYAHLIIIFMVGVMCAETEFKAIRVFGAINVVWTIVYAYAYAVWMLYHASIT